MSKITRIEGREILDSRGNPTVEVEIELESGTVAVAAVPSGASTGSFEALELRDGDKSRYGGKGVRKAVENVNEKIAPTIIGMSVFEQKEIDQKMVELDSTENKSSLGANAILGVSLAAARAAAMEKGIELYEYIRLIFSGETSGEKKMPVPMFNIINGGKHSDSGLAIQEFKVIPRGVSGFDKQLQAGSEVFYALKKILEGKGQTVGVGDEGGFAPKLESNREALEVICQAITEAGYKLGEEVFIGVDAAASSFCDEKNNCYIFKPESPRVEKEMLINIYNEWIEKFSVISVEDGLTEDDWAGWRMMEEKIGKKVLTIGDDLLVTNVKRLQKALEEKACNSVLVKVNQIGTLSETLDFVGLAQKNDLKVVVSHRSGETADDFISDLAVGVKADYIKSGAPNRGERIVKYNRLLRISQIEK